MGRSPSDIPGLVGWWRASDLALSDGTEVAIWPDASGHGHNASKNNPGPTYRATGGPASSPALEFAGTHSMAIPYSAELNGAALSAGIVVSNHQPSSYDGIYWWGQYGAARYGFMGNSASGILFYNGTGALTAGGGTDYHVATGTLVTGAQALFLDGTQVATAAGSYTQNTTIAGKIGRWGGGGGWTGFLAEIVHFDHVLTAAERATWHSYVQDTYGITVTDYVPDSGGSTPSVPWLGAGAARPWLGPGTPTWLGS